jgi:hypothetical protein
MLAATGDRPEARGRAHYARRSPIEIITAHHGTDTRSSQSAIFRIGAGNNASASVRRITGRTPTWVLAHSQDGAYRPIKLRRYLV